MSARLSSLFAISGCITLVAHSLLRSITKTKNNIATTHFGLLLSLIRFNHSCVWMSLCILYGYAISPFFRNLQVF